MSSPVIVQLVALGVGGENIGVGAGVGGDGGITVGEGVGVAADAGVGVSGGVREGGTAAGVDTVAGLVQLATITASSKTQTTKQLIL